jgi:hypothetical protein
MMLFFQRRRMLLLFALLFVSAVLLILWRANPRAELLTSPPLGNKPRFDFLGGLQAPVRNMWSRLKWKVLGPPALVSLEMKIVEIRTESPSVKFSSPLLSNDAGVQVWLLKTNEVSGMRADVSSFSDIETRDGMQSEVLYIMPIRIAGVPRRVGIELNCLPHVRGNTVDLALFLTKTEVVTNRIADSMGLAATNNISIFTNVAAGARIQVPKDYSVLLLSGKGTDGKRVGMIVSPKIRKQKR